VSFGYRGMDTREGEFPAARSYKGYRVSDSDKRSSNGAKSAVTSSRPDFVFAGEWV
jgi:hypothetical protein